MNQRNGGVTLCGIWTLSRKRRSTKKKFVRYKVGAEMYSMSQSKFEELAKDAKAIYKINKLVLVNTEILDEYLEIFRIVE